MFINGFQVQRKRSSSQFWSVKINMLKNLPNALPHKANITCTQSITVKAFNLTLVLFFYYLRFFQPILHPCILFLHLTIWSKEESGETITHVTCTSNKMLGFKKHFCYGFIESNLLGNYICDQNLTICLYTVLMFTFPILHWKV